MKRRGPEQGGMWVATQALPRSPGHVFYEKLNQVLEAGGFDRFVEDLCAPYYAEGEGRLSIEPGVYFRMLFIGYFEGLSSQRGIAWRCADSLSLRSFLGIALTKDTPEHSSMTRIRKRLPEDVFEKVFTFVLKVAVEHGLLKGKTIAVDATTLEANAAMKSLVRRDTGEDWKAYVRRLAEAEGIKDPTDEELRRFDRTRKKKTSNKDWESATDPDSRVTKMKDGRTHLAYKAENAVDVESEIVVAAVVYRADDSDPETLPVTIEIAREQLEAAGSPHHVEEALADKGYHKAETLQTVEDVQGVRSYIAEPVRKERRHWQDKPEGQQAAVYRNRRRIRGRRGRRLGRLRSERGERPFAHICETGGGRRAWLHGVVNVSKSYLARVAAHNLGFIMLALFGVGTPRSLQSGLEGVFAFLTAASAVILSFFRALASIRRSSRSRKRFVTRAVPPRWSAQTAAFSTGC
ncbi:MAG: transposase [Vicinamibacterales bacterium]|nr:transposase [Vicinamibacterales bacterium]